MNFQVKSNFEIKDADAKKGIVTGYASIFGNVDSDNEMVMPGAFAKTLMERGCNSPKPRIKHLWQHDSWQPIGVPNVLNEDEKGLYFETQFGKDSFSQDKLQQHIDKIITELSIGYNIVKQEDMMDADGKVLYRKLLELKLWEYSSVTWGANSLTEVISAKGEVTDVIANLNKRLEALNKGLKNGKYTDETCEQFEAEIGKIQNIIKSLEIKEPGTDPTLTVIEPTKINKNLESILLTLKNFNNG
jgi:HK97 family phage prohead protease